MSFNPEYTSAEPSRAEIDRLAGGVLLEFGSAWCGHCRRAAPLVEQAFAAHPAVRHVKIQDASGRPLGRSFGVKLWPTLIFLKDGGEISRLVRPTTLGDIEQAIDMIERPGAG